jgi:hypothetical protein
MFIAIRGVTDMPSLDDCTRLELMALARYSTPAQIAEAKARIARAGADRENVERRRLCEDSVTACRAARAYFTAKGADEAYRALFEQAKTAASRSAHARRRWERLEAHARGLERLARLARRGESP